MAFEVTPAVIADFRAWYPVFADVAAWPESDITRALYIGAEEAGGCNWPLLSDTLPDYGSTRRAIYAYAAHILFMWKRAAGLAGGGGIPTTPYAVSSKSVGDESVSYATPAGESGSGAWIAWLNLTPYGMEFVMLRRRQYAARVV